MDSSEGVYQFLYAHYSEADDDAGDYAVGGQSKTKQDDGLHQRFPLQLLF